MHDHTALNADAALAQSGDSAAAERLYLSVEAYLAGLAKRYHRTVDFDEAIAEANLAFMEAVRSFDPTRPGASFLGKLTACARGALAQAGRFSGGQAGLSMAASIAPRTMTRYQQILRAAGGDVARGADLAPSMDMSRGTFLEIAGQVADSVDMDGSAVDTTDPVDDPWHARFVDTEAVEPEAAAIETLLLETAWSAIDEFETEIVGLAYGFDDYNPCSDAEIAERLGGFSRPTIQRTRTRALGKMRVSLGLEP